MNNDIYFNVREELIPIPENVAGVTIWDTNNRSNFKMLVREDTGNPISVVTKDYKLIHNADLADACNKALANDSVKLVEEKNWADRRFQLKYRFENMVKIPHGGKWQEVYPELNVKNSYDATTGVFVLGGAFAFVCSNGMVIGVPAMRRNHHHINGNKALENLPELFTKVRNIMDDIIKDDIPFMADTAVHTDDVIWMQEQFPKKYHKAMQVYLLNNDTVASFWDLYQWGTYTTTHILGRKHESTYKLEDTLFQHTRAKAQWRSKQ